MVLKKLKESLSGAFHMASAEFMTGLKASFVCAPILILVMFVNCELSQLLFGIHNLVYIVSIIMGVAVGVSAVSHTFTVKGEAMLYSALPMGRRRITALRLSVRLLAAAVTIFVSCILAHLLIGSRYPEFYNLPDMRWLMQRSIVYDYSLCFSGVGMWLFYGVAEFLACFITFAHGYALGAFCGVVFPSSVIAALGSFSILTVGAFVAESGYSIYSNANVSDGIFFPLSVVLGMKWDLGFIFVAWKYWATVAFVILVIATLLSGEVKQERRSRIFGGSPTVKALIALVLFFGAVISLRSIHVQSIAEVAYYILGLIFDPNRLFK